MEHQRTGTKAIENSQTTQTLEPSTNDLPKATSEVELRTEVVDEAEAHTRWDRCIAYTMAMKPTIAPKTALSTSTPSRRW
jgi:hypothetical protein